MPGREPHAKEWRRYVMIFFAALILMAAMAYAFVRNAHTSNPGQPAQGAANV